VLLDQQSFTDDELRLAALKVANRSTNAIIDAAESVNINLIQKGFFLNVFSVIFANLASLLQMIQKLSCSLNSDPITTPTFLSSPIEKRKIIYSPNLPCAATQKKSLTKSDESPESKKRKSSEMKPVENAEVRSSKKVSSSQQIKAKDKAKKLKPTGNSLVEKYKNL